MSGNKIATNVGWPGHLHWCVPACVTYRWDFACFLGSIGLFFLMMGYSLSTQLHAEHDELQLLTWALLLSYRMLGFVTGGLWHTWQCEVTFQMVKLFFSLTAFPFFLFTIGPLKVREHKE